MATSFAPDSRPNLPAPEGSSDYDPFTTGSSTTAHHRYSNNFDNVLFASSPGSSPRQAKRALEAHLAETDRRLDEAGKLGTALVSQRKALAEQLQEVEKLEAEGELNPELRQKLVDIEKEYNDLARESARAFLPKQRVPSNEANPGSPFPGARNGRRSVSPSKFESQATGSPTKLSVPNRKIRNQPANRVHDIEFAAEISTSLIGQVRNLQALLAERDEEVRDLKTDKSALEIESESLHQRLKTLDESEHRYKEENWNLETRLQEMSSQQRDASDREKKLQQSLSASNTEKVAAQKELDEARLSHAKLLEEHTASVKHHDIELGTVKRNMVMADSERTTMQRKIDDLMHQNQELAKAFSVQRGKIAERDSLSGPSEDDFESAADNLTPEHSPPASPVKGTPRHSMLETETLKSSLHHAHRTIQSQRSQIHREKTEKVELRRIIQDLRDDLERVRTDSASSAPTHRKNRKLDPRDTKRYSRLLGSHRSSQKEIILSEEEPDWEDHDDHSPQASSTVTGGSSPLAHRLGAGLGNVTEEFDTANEASESAFETANERAGTETDDFQTGNEAFSGSDADDTETETTSRGFGRMKRPPPLPAGLSRHAGADPFDSTASTSGDELPQVRTPTEPLPPRGRFRLSRGLGRSRQGSEEPSFKSSPAASFTGSSTATPQGIHQSLFAELQDFAGSDEDSLNGTPSRNVRAFTPGSTRLQESLAPAAPVVPKPVMVDSGVMTDPIDLKELSPPSLPSDQHSDRPMSVVSAFHVPLGNRRLSQVSSRDFDAHSLRPLSRGSFSQFSEGDIDPRLSQFPAPPSVIVLAPELALSSVHSESVEPVEEPIVIPSLGLTSITAEALEPVEEVVTPPSLSISSIGAEHLEPVPELPPALSWAAISTQNLEPVAELPPSLSLSSIGAERLDPVPEAPPVLSWSSVESEHVEPVMEIPPTLTLSSIGAENLEPIAEPEPTPLALALSSISAEHLVPIAEPEPAPLALALSTISAQHLEPIAEPEPAPLALSLSSISTEHSEPGPEPEVPVLSMSSIAREHSPPREEPVPAPPALSMTAISREVVEPISPVEVVAPVPVLALSSIASEFTQPISPVEQEARVEFIVPPPPQLSMSSLISENLEPIVEPPVIALPPSLIMSSIATENVEPIIELPVVIPPPSLILSSISTENVEPVIEPPVVIAPPSLIMSSISTEAVEPVIAPQPSLIISSISTEHVEPVIEPSVVVPPPRLIMTSISTQNIEPIAEPEVIVPRPSLVMSSISTEHVEPLVEEPKEVPSLTLSNVTMEDVEPVSEPAVPVPERKLSSIFAENISPINEPVPALVFSSIGSEAIEPPTPVDESTDHSAWRSLVLPVAAGAFGKTHSSVKTSDDRALNSLSTGKSKDAPVIIAEDETSQPLETVALNNTAKSARPPLEEISANRKPSTSTSDNGAQTSLTADAIDQLFQSNSRRSHVKNLSIPSVGTPDTTGTVRITRSDDYTGSPVTARGAKFDDSFLESLSARRPGSATSGRGSVFDAPPLPANHREVIEAVRNGSIASQGSMGPPLWPASASKQRPQTPSMHRPDSSHSVLVGGSPRTIRGPQTQRKSDIHTPIRTLSRSGHSSVSSFASEMDTRFNIRHAELDPTGLGPNTDPRMIQAITQTMIGEYLWKYTRKTGRGEMSEKRHRRYFWVHPYTRTLYWSDHDPSSSGRQEHRAKSVPIEAVRVVTDDNPMPPGLHRKSIVIISPGRTIKFTCTTGQRHETWFNALSYLLLRTNGDGQTDTEEMVGNITRSDVDEFNPQPGQQPESGTRRRPPPSLSSYNSRATRSQSPTIDPSAMAIPTLTPKISQRPSAGTLSKFSGYFRPGNSRFGSMRGRGSSAQNVSIYEASEVHDSAEDLREMIERQDRESDRLENVRACCDGKHDVGTLHRRTKKSGAHTHSHAGPSTTTAQTSTLRSRA
ncbi:unnamed protein product [Clonostachys byssicola]|uniref:PH domain-containing protein n=1 Tax=Clonostachys byssicola TaxID=160290 RepID=A0A9N9UB95_9HYPO|nr:unnamed protein product [Clonostachys byssicola]